MRNQNISISKYGVCRIFNNAHTIFAEVAGTYNIAVGRVWSIRYKGTIPVVTIANGHNRILTQCHGLAQKIRAVGRGSFITLAEGHIVIILWFAFYPTI